MRGCVRILTNLVHSSLPLLKSPIFLVKIISKIYVKNPYINIL